jgi:hypothetical protein
MLGDQEELFYISSYDSGQRDLILLSPFDHQEEEFVLCKSWF